MAELKQVLKVIEDCEKAKPKQLEPLKSMFDQLKDYLALNNIQRITNEYDVITMLGGIKSQYYNACFKIVRVMIKGEVQKRRCVIFHGKPGSGKTRLAEYM